MNSNVLDVTYAVTAAFDVDTARVREAQVPGTGVPQSVLCAPVSGPAVSQRKRVDGNEHIFMIQAGAMGAGASGPSPWGCPV